LSHKIRRNESIADAAIPVTELLFLVAAKGNSPSMRRAATPIEKPGFVAQGKEFPVGFTRSAGSHSF
jgi:hypothetical protein